MASSERRRRSIEPTTATFANVTPRERYLPSWLAHRHRAAQSGGLHPGSAPGVQGGVSIVFAEELDRQRAGQAASLGTPGHSPSEHAEEQAPVAPDETTKLRAERAALEEARRTNVQLTRALGEAIRHLGQEREHLIQQAGTWVLELSTLIARRVIARELTVNPGIVQGLALEGIGVLADRRPLRVRLGSGFESELAGLEESLNVQMPGVQVHLDPSLDTFGCVVSSDIARVDESIDARLATLLGALEPGSEQ